MSAVTPPSCFVVMPIGKPGTEEHQHYTVLYRDLLKPLFTDLGYEVTRADESPHRGAITRDIILPLAEASLVIADLTDLNPNVFYELGVRHCLNRYGTLMLIDDSRTPLIPFDLSVYRVIKYSTDLAGVSKLRGAVRTYITSLADRPAQSDNPVHDWLPMLPENGVRDLRESEIGSVRSELALTRKKLQEYELRYGAAESRTARSTPQDMITALLEDARRGNLPVDLIEQAKDMAQKHNKIGFMEIVQRLVSNSTIRFAAREYLHLCLLSDMLGLAAVTTAIYDHALAAQPDSDDLEQAYMAHLAHSADPGERERARVELRASLRIKLHDDGTIEFPSEIGRRDLAVLGVMLDAYHRDGLYQQARDITQKLVELKPDSTIALRNHARVLEDIGAAAESLEWYRKAVTVDDADDTSAVWLGNELHNRHRTVDAIEAYALAVVLDPDESMAFAHLSDELAYGLLARAQGKPKISGRAVPDTITSEHLVRAMVATLSCNHLQQSDVSRCRDAAERLDLSFPEVLQQCQANRMGLEQRIAFAAGMYGELKSPITMADAPA